MLATLRASLEQFRKRERWLVAVGFGGLFAAYARLIRPVLQNGDTAVYNEQVDTHNFAVRVIHSGYFLIGSAFHALLPFQTDTSMNVMALTFGIGAAFALYATASFLGSRVAGVCSVAFLFCVHAFVRGSLLAEVDILETSLIIMSYALYVRRWYKVSGAVFGVAMLVTPVSAATLPLFLGTFALHEGAGWATAKQQARRVFWFGTCGLVVYLPVIAWHWQEYLYGSRSLTTAPRMPFDWVSQAERSYNFIATEAGAVLLLYLASIVSALTDKRLWRLDQPALGVVLSCVATLTLADRTSDVPVQLPNVVVLCLLAGLFVDRLAASTRAALVLPVAALLIMGVPAQEETKGEIEAGYGERKLYQSMRAQSLPYELVVVGVSGFNASRVFERYAYGKTYAGMALSPQQFRSQLHRFQQASATPEIWFVRGVRPANLSALGTRYELTQRQAEGSTFQVLAPRAAALAADSR